MEREMDIKKIGRYIEKNPDYTMKDIQRILMKDSTYCTHLLEEIGEISWTNQGWVYKRDFIDLPKERKPFNKYTMMIITTALILILFIGIAVYGFLFSSKAELGEREMEETTEQIQKEISLVGQGDQEVLTAMEERYSKPEAAIEFLFGIAMTQNADIFSEAFTVERFMEDIQPTESGNKIEAIQDVMSRLTKDGTLTKLNIEKKLTTLEKGTARFLVSLYYEDSSEPIHVQIKMKSVTEDVNHLEETSEDETTQEEQAIYYINTSVWDIIKKIEKG